MSQYQSKLYVVVPEGTKKKLAMIKAHLGGVNNDKAVEFAIDKAFEMVVESIESGDVFTPDSK